MVASRQHTQHSKGNFAPTSGYAYVVVIVNTSVSVSLYSLILFYTVTEPYLLPYGPITKASYHRIFVVSFSKLLSIKAVVFFAWWQSVGISILFYFDMIPSIGERSEVEVGSAINSILICIEMFLLSLINFFVFPYHPYKPQVRRHRKATEALKEAVTNFTMKVVNQRDIMNDVKYTFGKAGIQEANRKYQQYQPTETTPLVRRIKLFDMDEFDVDVEIDHDPFFIYSSKL